MRQTILVIACVAAVVLGSCKYRRPGAQTGTATDTIKAPKAPPAPVTSTDDALTQTVELTDTDARSEAEGGVLTEKSTVKTSTAVTGKVAGKRKSATTKQKTESRRQK